MVGTRVITYCLYKKNVSNNVVTPMQGRRNRGGGDKGGQRKVPSITKSDLIVTNIAITVQKSALLVNKSALSVQKKVPFQYKKCIFSPKKCPFSPLLSALLKTDPPRLPFGPSGTAAPMSFTK